MDPAGIPALIDVIREMWRCEARWIESVWVHDVRRDRVAFDGEVQVFEVTGRPQATRVYAWSRQIGRGPRWFQSVPNIPPVDGPLAAVRSAILDPYRPFRIAEN